MIAPRVATTIDQTNPPPEAEEALHDEAPDNGANHSDEDRHDDTPGVASGHDQFA